MLEFVALELHAGVERWVMIRNGVTECLEFTRRPLARVCSESRWACYTLYLFIAQHEHLALGLFAIAIYILQRLGERAYQAGGFCCGFTVGKFRRATRFAQFAQHGHLGRPWRHRRRHSPWGYAGRRGVMAVIPVYLQHAR